MPKKAPDYWIAYGNAKIPVPIVAENKVKTLPLTVFLGIVYLLFTGKLYF